MFTPPQMPQLTASDALPATARCAPLRQRHWPDAAEIDTDRIISRFRHFTQQTAAGYASFAAPPPLIAITSHQPLPDCCRQITPRR
jgi:hypothetical protein